VFATQFQAVAVTRVFHQAWPVVFVPVSPEGRHLAGSERWWAPSTGMVAFTNVHAFVCRCIQELGCGGGNVARVACNTTGPVVRGGIRPPGISLPGVRPYREPPMPAALRKSSIR